MEHHENFSMRVNHWPLKLFFIEVKHQRESDFQHNRSHYNILDHLRLEFRFFNDQNHRVHKDTAREQ